MGLEAATYVDDLVSTNPVGASDNVSQGDDHIRLLKAALKATFIGFSRAFYAPTTTTSQTSTVTVAIASQNKLIPVDCSGGAITVNLPQGSTLPDGFEVEIIKTDHTTSLITIDGFSSETINGATTQTLWQSYQTAKLRYSSSLSAWLMKREYVPPKGEITPWIGSSAVPEGGFLFPNGQTIGDASSSGSARANADCEGLYKLLYAQYSDTVCPVATGRGANAAADWSAHKTIGLPNLAGRTWIGLDNLGGISDAGLLTATTNGANTTGQTNGEAIGSESNTLSTAQLPVTTPTTSGFSLTAAAQTITTHVKGSVNTTTGGSPQSSVAVDNGTQTGDVTSVSAAASSSVSGSITMNSFGSGTAHANVQPSFVSAWKIKI